MTEIARAATELTFGIEIETTIPQGRIQVGDYQAALEAQGLPAGWQAKYDGSIQCTGRRQAAEFVSPILRGETGIASVLQAVAAIRALGAKVNESCGFHVHVGFDRGDGDGLARLVSLVSNFERAIFASTGTKKRERSRWCGGLQRYGRQQTAIGQSRSNRYHVLNLNNLLGNGHGYETVEFRAFAGTLNTVKIIGYVRMCLAFVERAINAKRSTNWTAKTPVETSPIHRGGEGQTALTRLYYQLGWTHGRTSYTYGEVTCGGAPSLRTIKHKLMEMAAQYDAEI